MLRTTRLVLRDVNWIGGGALGNALASERTCFVKVRSTQTPVPARFVGGEGAPGVELTASEFGVAAGQGCVFYEDGGGAARVLGGGFIASRAF
jgi:tRNA-uridine 2-sulfurtransferase